MKLSSDSKSPNFSNLVRYAAVLQNGVRVHNVIDVDTEAGEMTLLDPDGKTAQKVKTPDELTVLVTLPAVFEYGAQLNYLRTAHWLNACGKKQGDLGQLSTQVGVHIEECLEFLDQLNDLPGEDLAAVERLKVLAGAFKDGSKLVSFKNEEKALDALCDTEVTANGVAYIAGWHKPRADAKVLAANDAKLVDGKPVLLPGGKIGKPEGWSAADLSDCV